MLKIISIILITLFLVGCGSTHSTNGVSEYSITTQDRKALIQAGGILADHPPAISDCRKITVKINGPGSIFVRSLLGDSTYYSDFNVYLPDGAAMDLEAIPDDKGAFLEWEQDNDTLIAVFYEKNQG
jgi:hypothetical protein